jgi:hypothetical protein
MQTGPAESQTLIPYEDIENLDFETLGNIGSA